MDRRNKWMSLEVTIHCNHLIKNTDGIWIDLGTDSGTCDRVCSTIHDMQHRFQIPKYDKPILTGKFRDSGGTCKGLKTTHP